MEDFIYIILAVVWLVISVLGNKKKKAQQQQQKSERQQKSYETTAPTHDESQPEPSEFEVLLDDFFGQPTTAKKEPQPIEEKEKHVFSEDYTFEGYKSEEQTLQHEYEDYEKNKYEGKGGVGADYEFSAEGHVETIDELIKSYDEQERIAEEHDRQLVVVDLDETFEQQSWEFDAKQAIIYSEIINRKYT